MNKALRIFLILSAVTFVFCDKIKKQALDALGLQEKSETIQQPVQPTYNEPVYNSTPSYNQPSFDEIESRRQADLEVERQRQAEIERQQAEYARQQAEYDKQQEEYQKALRNQRRRAFEAGREAGMHAGRNDALKGNPMYTSKVERYDSDDAETNRRWNDGFMDAYSKWYEDPDHVEVYWGEPLEE